MSALVVLPVKWNFFYVNLSDNIPVLSWSAEQEAGTIFEIQRSYDGTTFTTIGVVASEAAKTAYQQDDRQVNTQSAVVYYRIKAHRAQRRTEIHGNKNDPFR
ncbi:MAG: hypothetical protein WDO16_05355 [Bacteroidota bacterium]